MITIRFPDDTIKKFPIGITALEIAKNRIQIMVDKGMDNEPGVLKGLIQKAETRIEEIRTGQKPALKQIRMRNILQRLLLILMKSLNP